MKEKVLNILGDIADISIRVVFLVGIIVIGFLGLTFILRTVIPVINFHADNIPKLSYSYFKMTVNNDDQLDKILNYQNAISHEVISVTYIRTVKIPDGEVQYMCGINQAGNCTALSGSVDEFMVVTRERK